MRPIPDAKINLLPNGIRVVSEEIPAFRSVAIGFLVGAGSGHEVPAEGGISHLIEHLQFKGTKTRSAYELAHTLDAIGGKMNAYTTKEYTVYYAVVLDKHIDTAIDILSDMLLNSLFDPAAIEMEKGVVLEEIKMYEDTPDELVHDFFAERILHGHPIGRPTIGLNSTVSSFDQKSLLDYRRKWYTPQNLIVSLAGAIPADITARLQAKLGGWTGQPTDLTRTIPEISGSLNLKQKKTEQVHLCLGTKGIAQTSDDRYIYTLLDNILGGSMSSRLFQEVREKRGLAYSIFSTASSFRDFGIAYAYAGTSKENLPKVIELVLAEFSRLKKEGINPAELTKAQEQIKGSLVLGMESTSARMNWLAKSEYYYNRTQTVDEIFAQVDRVKNNDIIHLAEQLFVDQYLTLAVIGDMDKLPVNELHC